MCSKQTETLDEFAIAQSHLMESCKFSANPITVLTVITLIQSFLFIMQNEDLVGFRQISVKLKLPLRCAVLLA